MLTYINCIIIFNILALNDPSTPFIDSPPFGYSTFSQNHKISISHLDGLFILYSLKGQYSRIEAIQALVNITQSL